MPHYADGTEAKVGDRVRGKGYNAAQHGYNPAVGIEGIVTEVRPGEKCTLTVAYLAGLARHHDTYGDGHARFFPFQGLADGLPLHIDLEYGDTQGFQKVG